MSQSHRKHGAMGLAVAAVAFLTSGRVANAQRFSEWSDPVNAGAMVNSNFFEG